MKLKLISSVSQSLLLARWKQTLVAAIGVTFSITMFITLLSFMTGLNDLLDGLILNRTAHVRLYNEIQPSKYQPVNLSSKHKGYYNFIRSIKPKNERLEIANSGAIIAALKKDGRVLGVAPKITAQVFYNVGAVDLTGIINGIDVVAENNMEQPKKRAPSKTVNPASRGSCRTGASLTPRFHTRAHSNPVNPFESAPTPSNPPARVSCSSDTALAPVLNSRRATFLRSQAPSSPIWPVSACTAETRKPRLFISKMRTSRMAPKAVREPTLTEKLL